MGNLVVIGDDVIGDDVDLVEAMAAATFAVLGARNVAAGPPQDVTAEVAAAHVAMAKAWERLAARLDLLLDTHLAKLSVEAKLSGGSAPPNTEACKTVAEIAATYRAIAKLCASRAKPWEELAADWKVLLGPTRGDVSASAPAKRASTRPDPRSELARDSFEDDLEAAGYARNERSKRTDTSR